MWPTNDHWMQLNEVLLGDSQTFLIHMCDIIFLACSRFASESLGCAWSKINSSHLFDSEPFCHLLRELFWTTVDTCTIPVYGVLPSQLHCCWNSSSILALIAWMPLTIVLCVFHLNPPSALEVVAVPLGSWTSWWLCLTADWSRPPNYSTLRM